MLFGIATECEFPEVSVECVGMMTTLRKLKQPRIAERMCQDTWKDLLEKLNKKKADDEPLSIRTINEALGPLDTIWAFRAVDDGYKREMRHFAVWLAKRAVLRYTLSDQSDFRVIEVAERYLRGEMDREGLVDAGEEACKGTYSGACSVAEFYACDAAFEAALFAERVAVHTATIGITADAMWWKRRDESRKREWDLINSELRRLFDHIEQGKPYTRGLD